MPEEVTEVVQPKPGVEAVVNTEVKAEPKTDGGETKAEVSTELQSKETTVDKATTETGDKPAVETEGEVKTESKGLEKRFAEITRKQKEAERRAADAEAREKAAIEALTRLGKEPVKAEEKSSDADPKPDLPQFEDPSTFAQDMAKYTEQLTMWAARQAVKADRAESEKKRLQETQEQTQIRVRSEFKTRRDKALETFTDYVEVAENPELPITEVMASAIQIDPEGPAINYYLGQNPEEAATIAKLPPGQQLIEIGAIRAKLLFARKSPEKPLPKPIKPQTGSTGITKSIGDLDMEEYAAARNSELRSARAAH